MKRLLYGLAALPLLAGVALAQEPTKLGDAQMDKVTAGWGFAELDVFNTGVTAVSVYQPAGNAITGCAGQCYLNLQSNSLSIASIMFGGLPPSP